MPPDVVAQYAAMSDVEKAVAYFEQFMKVKDLKETLNLFDTCVGYLYWTYNNHAHKFTKRLGDTVMEKRRAMAK